MKEDIERKRKPYKKPQVKQIELVAEEQVLGGCKTEFDGAGPGDTNPNCTEAIPPCEFTTGT